MKWRINGNLWLDVECMDRWINFKYYSCCWFCVEHWSERLLFNLFRHGFVGAEWDMWTYLSFICEYCFVWIWFIVRINGVRRPNSSSGCDVMKSARDFMLKKISHLHNGSLSEIFYWKTFKWWYLINVIV